MGRRSRHRRTTLSRARGVLLERRLISRANSSSASARSRADSSRRFPPSSSSLRAARRRQHREDDGREPRPATLGAGSRSRPLLRCPRERRLRSLAIAIPLAGVLLKPIGPELVFVVGGSIALLAALPSTRPPRTQPIRPAPETVRSDARRDHAARSSYRYPHRSTRRSTLRTSLDRSRPGTSSPRNSPHASSGVYDSSKRSSSSPGRTGTGRGRWPHAGSGDGSRRHEARRSRTR